VKVLDREISFVVQGPIVGDGRHGVTSIALRSINKHFPESDIILSTWRDSSLGQFSRIKNLTIVESQDPGSYMRDKQSGIFHNANRQIVSTLAGLSKVETEYAVKIRSDLQLTGRGISRWLTDGVRYSKREEEFCWLTERAVVVNVTSVDPRAGLPLPFHPCDWIYFGLTIDLREIWDCPAFPEPEWTQWFDFNRKPENFPFPTSSAKFHPENYVWSNFVKKFMEIKFDHSSDASEENIVLSERVFVSNLLVVSRGQINIRWLKSKVNLKNLNTMYSFRDWRKLVRQYTGVDPGMKIDTEAALVLLISFSTAILRKVLKWILGRS
jgi:hypothetical protein